MLSRVASSIYWMNRQIERAENLARFVEVNLQLVIDSPPGAVEQWQPLVDATGDHEDYKARYGTATRETVIEFLSSDPANPNSIFSCLAMARENARTVRESISNELWLALNDTFLSVCSEDAKRRAIQRPIEFFAEVRNSSRLIEGITNATLLRGEAWHFSRLGRMIERADKTSRILDIKYFFLLPDTQDVGTPLDDLHWFAVLESTSASEMFRLGRRDVDVRSIADFLVLNPYFPRSVRFCTVNAGESMSAITGSAPGMYSNDAERLLGRMGSRLEFSKVEEIIHVGLHEYLDACQTELNAIGAAIDAEFFIK